MLGLSLKLYCDEEDRFDEHLSKLKWSAEKSRKYWTLFKHCHNLSMPTALPVVSLLTDDSRYYWHIFSAKGKYNKCYQKDLNDSLKSTLMKVYHREQVSLTRILLSEQLINNLKQFDALSRKSFIQLIADFIRKQSNLEIVCLEGLGLTKSEGAKVLSALSASNKSIKFLYLWRAFENNECTGTKACHCAKPTFQMQDDCCWLHAMKSLKFLDSISLNYNYVASEDGDILINLARQLGKHWNYLQLLCLEKDIKEENNKTGVQNAIGIPDFAWDAARKYSPHLKVQFVWFGMPEYDLHKRFFTQSIPLQTLLFSTNQKILFNNRPSMLDCTFKTIISFYCESLVQLHLNCYNHREMLDNHLRKILPSLPNLKIFEFIGKVKELVTVITMCCQIRNRSSRAIKAITMQLQTIVDKDDWLTKVSDLLSSFKCEFDTLGVTFEVCQYPF